MHIATPSGPLVPVHIHLLACSAHVVATTNSNPITVNIVRVNLCAVAQVSMTKPARDALCRSEPFAVL